MAILDPTSRFQEAGEVTADKSQMTGGAVRQTRSAWHCPQRRHQEESRKMERLGVDQARHLAGFGTSGDRQMGPGEQTLRWNVPRTATSSCPRCPRPGTCASAQLQTPAARLPHGMVERVRGHHGERSSERAVFRGEGVQGVGVHSPVL